MTGHATTQLNSVCYIRDKNALDARPTILLSRAQEDANNCPETVTRSSLTQMEFVKNAGLATSTQMERASEKYNFAPPMIRKQADVQIASVATL